MKFLFTKTQAVSILVQIKNGVSSPDHMLAVDPQHSLFSQSCEELEKNLSKYVNDEIFAGVVEDPIFLPSTT